VYSRVEFEGARRGDLAVERDLERDAEVSPRKRDRDRAVWPDRAPEANAAKAAHGAEIGELAAGEREDDPGKLGDGGEEGELLEVTLEVEELRRQSGAERVRGARRLEAERSVGLSIRGHGGGI